MHVYKYIFYNTWQDWVDLFHLLFRLTLDSFQPSVVFLQYPAYLSS